MIFIQKRTQEQFSRIFSETGSRKKFSRLSEKTNFTSAFGPDSLKISTTAIFSIFKVFYSVKVVIYTNDDVRNSYMRQVLLSYFLFNSILILNANYIAVWLY